MQLSKRLQNLKPSATIAMSAKARELKSQGIDVISLSIGEPDFNTPDFIKEAAKKAIDENYSGYPPIAGYADLKETICKKFKRDNNIEYTANQVVVSTGAKQSIYNVLQAIVDEGTEVIIPTPYWVSYSDIVELSGGTPVFVEGTLEADFKITPAQLEAAITDKTRAIIYSSPCNPSGSVYTREELKGLAEVLAKYPDVIIISDEIYEHIVYGDKNVSIASFPEVYNQTVTVNGLAKAFAMTGWRIGFIGAPAWLAKACETLQGQVTSGATSIAQRAAITALEADPSSVQYMVDAFAERRELMLGWAKEIPTLKVNEPKGAFYLFPDVTATFGNTYNGVTINNADDLALYLLEHAQVAVVSGSAFGSKNCIRISYAASVEELKEAMTRIKNALA
ncbi:MULTISPECIES: pyridoxal phosphate-dependent aminotransferase [Empedobacter]|uniref:Aminotransferase n=1 Tax=Empedobacter falsenii TaxID=343874 RepID=A0A376GHF9_9FLAO|nr:MULTISPECIES: pyridoxal phosphate-dependent aminotransferase [Empedobacter]RRT91078.1 pyridoxal phosphate-dependent aminotransferase [Empedobacter falsenii]RRT91124.1 pyridoxal phosphate-dependent aminotransferase [Empedobacter falsenii]STD59804.1 Aspartate aminotransferase [Empedobacter falsenii]HBX61536.1 aspartate aminotransferase [Flavobacteriaceae bacterium]